MIPQHILEQLGGKLWQSGDKRRVYINDLAGWYGLETTHYKTGNVSSASIHGEPISNGKARGLETTFRFGKLYYDLTTGTWGSRDLDAYAPALIARIEARVAELTKPRSYDKAAIMRRAWQIARLRAGNGGNAKAQLSDALKAAWAYAKSGALLAA